MNTPSIEVETGTMDQELSINGEVVSDSIITLKPFVFFDLLVDFKETDAKVIFNDSVIVIDVVLRNVENTPFTFSVSSSTSSELVKFCYLDTSVVEYYDTINNVIKDATTSTEINQLIEAENSRFLNSTDSLVLKNNDTFSFKVILFGYQPDSTQTNVDFMNETYTYTLTSYAEQYFEGELS